jgi:hypothetical protein
VKLDWKKYPLLNQRGDSGIPDVIAVGQIWKRKHKSRECQNDYLVVLGFIQLGLPNKPWYGVRVHSFDPTTKQLIGGDSRPGLQKFTEHYSFTGELANADALE